MASGLDRPKYMNFVRGARYGRAGWCNALHDLAEGEPPAVVSIERAFPDDDRVVY